MEVESAATTSKRKVKAPGPNASPGATSGYAPLALETTEFSSAGQECNRSRPGSNPQSPALAVQQWRV